MTRILTFRPDSGHRLLLSPLGPRMGNRIQEEADQHQSEDRFRRGQQSGAGGQRHDIAVAGDRNRRGTQVNQPPELSGNTRGRSQTRIRQIDNLRVE